MKLSRLLLASSSLMLVNLIGATTMNTTITVTTLVDENGENPDACSLREAIKANNDVLPFGGCTPGDRYLTNTIKLPKGTITLTHGVLKSARPIKLSGADPDDHEALNPFFYNSMTKLGTPVTIIDGNGGRILDTTGADSSLELENLNIRNGKGDRGSAILAGGTVTARRTFFVNNIATSDGGAIYISGPKSGLTLQTTQFESNNAARGAAIAMSCMDNLVDTNRSLDLTNATFINNGSDNSMSVIESCGSSAISIKSSTFGENPLPAIVRGLPAGIIRMVDKLGTANTLSLSQVTAIKNGKVTGNAASFLLYNNASKITIQQSVIAFNHGNGCMSISAGDQTTFDGNYNLIENCSIPSLLANGTTSNDITGKAVNVDNEFEPSNYYGGITKVYLPKLGSQYIIDKGPADSACLEDIDQRGAARNSSMICDIGSVERRQLVSTEDMSSKNQPKAGRVVIADVLVNDTPDESVTAGIWDIGSFNDAAPAWPTLAKALADGKINRNPKKYSLIPSPTTAKDNCATLDVLSIVDGFLDRAIQSTDTTVRAALASSLEKLRKTTDKADAIDDINNLLSHADKQHNAAVAAKAAAVRAKLKGTTIDIDVLNGLIDLADAIIAADEATRAEADSALNTAMLAGNQSLATQKNIVIQDIAKDTEEAITLKRAFMNRISPIFDTKVINAVATLADGLLAADAKTKISVAAELQAARDANNQTQVNQKTAELALIESRMKSTRYNQTLLLALKPDIATLGDSILLHEMLYFRYADPTYLPLSGSDNQCHYRIGYPAATSAKKSNESVMHLAISNVAPTAAPDTVILPFGNSTVSMDLLANDDDDGDNFFDANDKAMPGPGGFYTDNAGSLNIRVTVEPKLGYLTADASGPCPDNSTTITKTCYHGTITYHSNNTLAPFSDSFSYQVIDKDMTSSGEAKVNILNTDSPEYKKLVGDTSGDSSHGGSLGILGLLGLTALGILRHRSMTRRNP